MSGTHRDLLFGSKSRCFACENYRWGQGSIETSNSEARHNVLHAENHGWVLGPIETCNFGPIAAGFHAKTTDEGWDQWRLVFLMLGTLFSMQKITGEVWDPQRLVILVQKSLFCMQKPQVGSIHLQRLVILVLKSLFCMHKTTSEGWNPYSLLFLS